MTNPYTLIIRKMLKGKGGEIMRKNSLLFVAIVLTAFLTGSIWGQTVSEVEEATLAVGSTGNVLNLSMDNPNDNVAAYMVDILFDTACFTVTGIGKAARSANMDIVNYTDIAGGIRIVLSGIGHAITPGSGPIVEITVDVDDGCVEGDYLWDVTVQVVADPEGGKVEWDDVDNYITVTGSKSVKGDLNGDGSIDVVDVLAVVNHILEINPLSGDAFLCADCSGDKAIDILDAIGIVNVILEIGECVQ